MNKDRIKLLMTDDSLPLGGKETLLLNYLKKIDRGKIEVNLVTLTSYGVLINEAKKYSDKYACMRRKFKADLNAICRLRSFIKKNQIQIIHTNQWIDSLYVYIASLGLRIKKVSTIHGYISGWRRWVSRFILRRFDKVICVSGSSRDELIKQGYFGKNMVIVYNSIDISKFVKKPFSHSLKKHFIIGMTGSFRKERDHITVLKAVQHLIRKGQKNLEVRFIGGVLDPECIEETMKYALENKIGKYINFFGVQRNIPELLSQLNIYIASSYSETFGIALVEAMACGLPVIVSEIPAFMEIIENGKYGLHFKKSNYLELAEKIEFLINDKFKISHYGTLAHKRAAEFSIDSSIEHLEDIYQRIYNSR